MRVGSLTMIAKLQVVLSLLHSVMEIGLDIVNLHSFLVNIRIENNYLELPA